MQYPFFCTHLDFIYSLSHIVQDRKYSGQKYSYYRDKVHIYVFLLN